MRDITCDDHAREDSGVASATISRSGGGPINRFLRRFKTEIALAGIALVVYLPGIGWGLPYATDALRTHGWATDAITPLEPISQFHSLIWPQADRWVVYPLMQYLLLAVAYTPYVLYLVVTGRLAGPSGRYPFGLSDPEGSLQVMELLGKSVSVLMAAGIVVAVYQTGKTLWGRTTGLLAGMFVMLMYPMVYYARTGNLDVPVLFWTSLGLLLFARILEHGLTTRRAVWLGVFAAFAIATKDQAWGAFMLLPVVLVAWQLRISRQAGLPMPWRPLMTGLAASSAVYALTSGLALSPERHFAHIRWIREHVPFPGLEHFPATLEGLLGLLAQILGQLSDAVGPVMLAASVVGVFVVGRQEPKKLAMLLPAIGHFVFVLAPVRMSLLRYIMPIALVLCVFAARGIAQGLTRGGWPKRFAAGSASVICAWLFLLGADLTWQMWQDSHYPAAAWLEQHTQPGDTVGTVAATASLPRLKPGIRYVLMLDGNAENTIAQQRPKFLIIMPDWTTPKGGIHPRSLPTHTYLQVANGRLGYRLGARFHGRSLITRQILDYPTVNPPIEIYVRHDL